MIMATTKPRIVLCICTYNRYDLLPKAIESAMAQTLPKNQYDILVVDNSPDHKRAAAFGKKFAAVKNLSYVVEETPGLSNARNLAASLSRAPIIAFMDDDAIAAPNWAEEILGAFERFGPSTMIVGGRVDPIWSAPRPAWVHDSMLGSLSVVNWGGDARVAKLEEWVAGTNISFRISAIVENGGFPRNLGRIGSGSSLLSNEEVHLVEKIRASGGTLVYAPNARVDHLVDLRRLTRTWFRKRAAWQALSDFMMDPDRQAKDANEQWPNLVKYFNAMPPHERTVRGLLYDTDDPGLFRWQTSAVYMLTTLLLAGFEGVELD
jgi:glycosyltransferase involved in cell wall biosynthesis